MRALVLSDLWLPFPGGAERYIYNLAKTLAARMQVAVLTGYEDAQSDLGLIVAPIGIREDHAEGWATIWRYLDTLEPDLILTHHFYAAEFADELAACGIPFVQAVYNGRRHPAASFAVVISEWAREHTPGVLDTDLTIMPWATWATRALSHEHAIGMVKPLYGKGIDLVYRLAERLPDERFVILRGEWQHLEMIRGDLPNVRYMEPIIDIRDFWSQVDLALVPSLSEDAGTVAQEATANRLPCISSNVGGLPETNAGGVLLDPHDVDGWEAAIHRLRDPHEARRQYETQRAALNAHDHGRRLEEFTRRCVEATQVTV
jgi:glycosyltransferase involved in cell wall biosynthesis